MAALIAGVQYGLSSQGNFNENKELIFVKLTDSAYRAIEEYLRNRSKCSKTPTIQFLGNEGHLCFPSSQSARGEAGFNFSLSSNADIEGPQGSFECIQQTSSRCLESVGALQCKLRIHANEDVYEATRHRMAAVEEQHKKNCTREIELDKAGIGRRVKVRSKPTASIPSRAPNGYHHAYTSSSHSAPNHPVAPAPSHTKPQGNNHAQKPGNPEIMRRPIRDRLIHLLAVRPYKKPEIYAAITRDGLREKDKNQLMSTLSSIATVRDNTYHLIRHIWNDVQEDWPFYTEQDRQMLKRRKPQNLTPPGSSDGGSSVGSGQSPSSVHPGSPPSAIEPPPLSVKRPGYYNGADGLPTKRQRIAHNRKTEEVYRRSESPAPTPAKPTPPSKPDTYHNNNYYSSNSSNNNNYTSSSNSNNNSNSLVPGPTSVQHQPPPRQEEPNKPLLPKPDGKPPPSRWDPTPPQSAQVSSLTSLSENDKNVSPALKQSPSVTEYPNYIREYTTIQTLEQRRRYKEEFNADYAEYRNLHSKVDEVSQKFAQLEKRLQREEKGSDGWKIIKNQIVKEYQENKRNTKHQEDKRRFQYLHEKLSHIKRLVLEFDSAQHT